MRFWRVYGIVFRKELRELLRDRRSLFWLFAPPIILPGMALCAGIFIGTQAVRIASEGFPIILHNAEAAPELAHRFAEHEGIRVVEAPPPDAQDVYGEAVAIVEIPPDFQQRIANQENVTIEILTPDSSIISIIGRATVRGVISDYSQALVDERLAAQGLDRGWLDPIQIGESRRAARPGMDDSDDEDSGGNILATIFLPLAVTSWLLGGGMGLVLDTTVGEKERQTIENLLVTPASRIGIVMGKMTVVFLASLLVMSLWLGEGIVLNAFGSAGPELSSADLSLEEALRILATRSGGILGLVGVLVLLIIPFTVMLNGLVMAWCAFASNYREANLVMALMQLGLPASVLLTIFSFPPEVVQPVYAIPFLGTIVAIRDLFSGSLESSGLLLNCASGILYAGLAVGFAAWMFEREWSLTRGLQ